MDIHADAVYTHFANDLNIDHSLTARAVFTAFRPQPGSSVKQIFSFEVLPSTEWTAPSMRSHFVPNHFVNISKTMDTKMEALEAYQEELRPSPHSRSIENIISLASFRGMSVGVKMAEAFICERNIVN